MDFDAMQKAQSATTRRTALPRNSAMPDAFKRGADQPGAPSIAAFGGGFMGFAEESNEPDPDDWFENKQVHVVVAGPFEGVKVLMTKNEFGVRRWMDTEIKGNLRLVQVKEFQGFSSVLVQITGTDAADIERDIVFDYELPFNFTFERDLSNQFCGIKLGNGEYIGLFFRNVNDKAVCCNKIAEIQSIMTVTPIDLEALRLNAIEEMSNEKAKEIGENIDCDNLLSG